MIVQQQGTGWREVARLTRFQKWACVFAVCLVACGTAELAAPVGAPASSSTTAPEVEVVQRLDDPQGGGDEAPRFKLAFRHADGRQTLIEGEARSYAPFRDGVALVDTSRQLLLVSPSGSRRVLAAQAGAPPVRGPSGALFYVARYGLKAELHVLDVLGSDRMVGTGFTNAGLLAPQQDERILFVAARSGGVAGLWIADQAGARCLTNCELGRAPWGDAFVPLPKDRETIVVQGDSVRFADADGTTHTLSLIAPTAAEKTTAPESSKSATEQAQPSKLEEAR